MEYINGLTLKKLKNELSEELELKAFRGEQLFRWIHSKKILDLVEAKNLNGNMISKIEEKYKLDLIEKVEMLKSKEDNTKKYLFRLDDGNIIEAVYMKYKHGNSLCISSQAGCRMDCKFCASAKNGLARNLRASEMIEQIYSIERDLDTTIDSIVVMGTGEPFENFDNLMDFLDIIADEKGKNLSKRKITISTCGIVPKIYELADKEEPYNLAISLHSAFQRYREEMIPIAKQNKIEDIVSACDYYFKNFLKRKGVNATVRRKLGRDIDGACGQLRRKFK